MTSFADGLYQFDGVPVGMQIPAGGDHYWLDPTNGSDDNTGRTPDAAFATLAAAEDKLTAGQHDILYYVSGSSSVSLSSALTWDKDYTHLVGVCAPTGVGNRARIFQTATATGLSPLITISASGCIFSNFYVFQGVDDATSLINVSVTGSRNYFENVHFAGGGHASMAIDGCASLQLNGGSENLFRRCTIGVDTIEAATGVNAINLDGSASRNRFDECLINLYVGNAGARLVELADTTAVDRYTIFDKCTFFSNSTNKATTMASAFEIPSGHTTTATIFLKDCAGLGFTDWDDDDRAILYLNTGTITGGGNSGFYAVSAAT